VKPDLVLVAAVAQNRVIGHENRLLWRLKTDMKHFRALSLGKPVIMGRKTFLSIGKPLPGRETIILTRDAAFQAEGADIVHTPEAALALGADIAARSGGKEIMVAGGGEIYTAFLPLARRLEITHVMLEPEGDTWFPVIDAALWRAEHPRDFPKSVDDEAAFRFLTYHRR